MAPKAFGADTSCDEGVAATTGDVLRPITASLRLRLAKRAEGSLKCNARFPAGAGAICKCEVPRRLRGSE